MTAAAALRHACDDLTLMLAYAHAVLDARERGTPMTYRRAGEESTTCGLCYERQAA